MARSLSIVAALAALASALVQPAVALTDDGAAAEPVLRVEFDGGLLTVEAREAPLADFLFAFGEAVGVEVPESVDPDVRVSGAVHDVALETALHRLLANTGFAVLYDSRGAPKRLVLAGSYSGPEARLLPSSPPEVLLVEEPSMAEREAWIDRRLSAEDLGTRIVAVRRLASLPPERAILVASRVLHFEQNPVVRAQAAAALTRIDDESTVPALGDFLDDRDPSVRRKAVDALRRHGREAAIRALGGLLTRERDPTVRSAVVAALESAGGDLADYYLGTARSPRAAGDAARRDAASAPSDDAIDARLVPCLTARGRLGPACVER